MKTGNPVTGLPGWILHRVVASYWFLALCAVISAPIALAAVLHLDRNGLTAWLLDRDLAPVETADAAKEVVGIIAGIDAAYITLYFSISLIVLTIAAGNLGVRLIDRWLGKRLVRVSIGGLSFTLIFTVLTLASVDSEAALADTPLTAVAASIGFLLINTAMLAVALHDLGRTMFVDSAIDELARDAARPRFKLEGAAPFTGKLAYRVAAPRDGYVEGMELDKLERRLAAHPGAIRICVAPGQHVLHGEALIALEHELATYDDILGDIPIGSFRSNSQGAVFQIRLLVEIAARALSPAVNDFYTALAVADALTEVIVGHRETWVDHGAMPVIGQSQTFELPGQDFRGLFQGPLAAFRQAAADYPSVAIHMIRNYRRICDILFANAVEVRREGLINFLYDEAKSLSEHAAARAQHDADREHILTAFDEFRQMRNAGRMPSP